MLETFNADSLLNEKNWNDHVFKVCVQDSFHFIILNITLVLCITFINFSTYVSNVPFHAIKSMKQKFVCLHPMCKVIINCFYYQLFNVSCWIDEDNPWIICNTNKFFLIRECIRTCIALKTREMFLQGIRFRFVRRYTYTFVSAV